MITAEFQYEVPETIEEALELLARHGEDAKVLTGGHSLLPMMKLRLARPEVVIDLRLVPGLGTIERADGTLTIGAGATHAAIASSEEVRATLPVLAPVTLAATLFWPWWTAPWFCGGWPDRDFPTLSAAASSTMNCCRRWRAFVNWVNSGRLPWQPMYPFRAPPRW